MAEISWENDKDVEELFDFLDPKYSGVDKASKPLANIQIKQLNHTSSSAIDNHEDSEDVGTEIIKPNLDMIATMIEGIGTTYLNDDVENAFGKDGYMIERNKNTDEKIKTLPVAIFSKESFPPIESNSYSQQKKLSPQTNDKKESRKKNIFKSQSHKKIRNLALLKLIENKEKQTPDRPMSSDDPPLVINEQNIIDSIDLTKDDTLRKVARSRLKPIDTRSNQMLPMIDPNDKVSCWLNSNSDNNTDYMNQLATISKYDGDIKEYVPDENVDRMYEELMKNKMSGTKNTGTSNPKSNPILWDSVQTKLNL